MLLLRIFGLLSSLGLIWIYYDRSIAHPGASWIYGEIIRGNSLSTTILTGIAELILGLIVIAMFYFMPELVSFFRRLIKMKKQENLQRQQEGCKVDLRKGFITLVSSYNRSHNQQLIKSK